MADVEPVDRTAATVSQADALLAEAFVEHGPVLLAVARAITRDWSEAQDVVQTTFEIAIRHRTELRDPAAVRAWLIRIEAREATRLVRRLARLVSLDRDVGEVREAPEMADVLAVREALAGLPRRERAALVLHQMLGLSIDETATALGVSPNTIRTQVRKGTAKVREQLR